MGLVGNPYSLLGFASWAFVWALAALAFLAAPRRFQNRGLAVMLGLLGISAGVIAGLYYASDEPCQTFAAQI